MSLPAKARVMLNRARMLPKAFAQADAGTVKRRLVAPARRRARNLLVKSFRHTLNMTDRVLGAEAGNAMFWRVRDGHNWSNVNARLMQLYESQPAAIPNFTRHCYENATNPEVVINLARSALTKETMRDCLNAETLDGASDVRQRMARSQMTCAGFISAATLLLSDQKSAEFALKAKAFSPEFSALFRRMMDSSGAPITASARLDARRRLISSGFKTPKKKRLIIVQSEKSLPTLPLLFSGAENVTVFALDDLYGRANFSDRLAHSGPCHVDVEHCRTRITRFSAAYHKVHEDTRAAAVRLTGALAEAGGTDLTVDDPSGLSLALADQMFFPTLQFAAMQRLIDSDEFDHVVIALNGAKGIDPRINKKFVRLVSGVKRLAQDPRVELVCLSPSQQALTALDSFVKVLSAGLPAAPAPGGENKPLAPAAEAFRKRSATIAQGFEGWPKTDLPRVLLATSQVAAYNKSSKAYSQALADVGNLRVAFLGGNLLSFTENMDDRITPDMIRLFPQRPDKGYSLLLLWLIDFLRDQLGTISTDYVAHVLSGSLPDVARNGILSYMAHSQLCDAWFARLDRAGELPKSVVLTPFRSVRVAAFAAVARRYGVPSIAIEPHGLNADYCRYCKVSADYYGVISHFFADAAVDGFGMTLDRCPIVGSPRLQGPKDYDVPAVTAEVRQRLKDEDKIDITGDRPVFSYFTQPSDWNQISEVWRIILKATEGIDCVLVLKTHPEETNSRVNAYLAIAEELNAMNRVRLVETDAVSLIEASDLVLSGYSATVVEAALYRRPVFCVTNGRVEYPLGQHEVIGGPLFRSTTALRKAIKSFLKDATPYQSTAADFLEREPQFLDGFEEHLKALVTKVMDLPPEQSLRSEEELPASLFLDGPHTVYKI